MIKGIYFSASKKICYEMHFLFNYILVYIMEDYFGYTNFIHSLNSFYKTGESDKLVCSKLSSVIKKIKNTYINEEGILKIISLMKIIVKNLLPNNISSLFNFSIEIKKYVFEKPNKFSDYFDIGLIVKIQSLDLFVFCNMLLVCVIIIKLKKLDMINEIILNKIQNFILDDVLDESTHNFIEKENCLLIKYLHIKYLDIFLYIFERKKLPFNKIWMIYNQSKLQSNQEITITLIVYIIRQFILAQNYNFAISFVKKSNFKVDISVTKTIRFYYYLAKIYAIRKENSLSAEYLLKCHKIIEEFQIKKTYFLKQIFKMTLILSLKVNIPNMKCYLYSNIENYEFSLLPYLLIHKYFLFGKYNKFLKIVKYFEKIFFNDRNFLLIYDLRSHLISQFLRSFLIKQKYYTMKEVKSMIFDESLNDVYQEENLIYIIMKNIRDGVLRAKITEDNLLILCD
jgi:hypothetical protein